MTRHAITEARRRSLGAIALLLAATPAFGQSAPATVVSDWRKLDPADTLYLELPTGRAIIELASAYAPRNAAAMRALVRESYFDGSFIVRAQDNYVVQWSRLEDDERAKQMTAKKLAPAFARPIAGAPAFTRLPYPDTYAAEVGFAAGFPAARERRRNETWLVHCYGMVGVGRDNAADSGNGSELYAVIGHSPRHLDRNITLVGRVVQGIELLSVLPRGAGPLGFYEKAAERTPISRARMASDVPPAERSELEALRTDSKTFRALVESRANRREEWFKEAAGRIGVCNVPLPVRKAQAPARP